MNKKPTAEGKPKRRGRNAQLDGGFLVDHKHGGIEEVSIQREAWYQTPCARVPSPRKKTKIFKMLRKIIKTNLEYE